MAHHLSDNIYTKGFTPREYQVEVLHNVKEHNIIVRSGNSTTKTFIALKLIQEFANNIRRSYTNGGKRTLFVAGSLTSVVQNAITIRHLSDLKVGEYCATSKPLDIINHQVLVMTSDVCWFHINNGNLKLADINLLIADECHQAIRAHPLQQIMEVFGQIPLPRPHVLGLTTLLVPEPGGADPGRLEAEIQRLESVFHCRAETASDIVSVLRYCAKPKEMVVECADYPSTELSNIIEEQMVLIVEFLDDHRYNPSEIYYEESPKDFIKIPNPKKVPYNLLKNFWQILKTMGPWCADKAALALLIQIEKLKVKTQYKRHVLLLCLVSSLLIKIRAICEDALQEFKEKEKILKFSSPKILRLIEIIRQFKPKSQPPDIQDNIETESNTSINCNQETFNSKSAEELSSENHDSISSMISSSDEVSSNMFKESGNDNDSCYAHDRDNNVASDSKKDESNGAEGEDYVSVCDEKLNEPVKINSVLQDNLNSDNLLNNVNYNDNNSSLNRQEHCNKMNDNVSKNNIENDFKSSDSLDEFKSNFNSCNDNLIKNCEISNNASKYTKDSRTSVYSDVMSKPSIDNISTELSLVLMDSTNNVQNIELSDNIRCSCPPNNGMPKITSGEECAMRGERWQGRGQGWRLQKRVHPLNNCKGKDTSLQDSENLCAIIFVKNRFTAKILFYLLNELRKFDPDFEFLCPQYIVEKTADPATESHKAEKELKRQEKVLERFRMGECNMLVATSVLEEGIDLPKCNLIIRYDIPSNYRSYVHSKGRACGQDSHYLLMVEESQVEGFVADLAQFMEIEKMLLVRCTNREPSDEEEIEADLFTNCVIPYTPVPGKPTNVNMANAIALVNRYCAKLPSDDFTHLTPLWWIKEVSFNGSIHFVCTVRLPINSSVKQDIVGHPMPTRALARRIVALEVCRVLHMTNELDDQLQPTGKETFTSLETAVEEEPDSEDVECISAGPWDTLEPRPGTTKRRQYYYKRIASSLSGCRPTPGKAAKLYQLKMVLTCPLPEEQNTRGWKIHPPEDAPKGFGILTLKDIPKICPFPIFTRSGEVRVSLELKGEELFLNERQLDTIAAFLHYTFTNVLRLQKYLTLFHPNASENSLLVVPTKKTDSGSVDVDWDFLELIYLHKDDMLQIIPGEVRATFTFESLKFHDTVVMPCYRNQDQPQYFYVVDICDHLNPKSSFPRNIYKTFEEYYLKKYGIQVQNTQQPLLEVNPTSTRLNFLTPRYVSHKGVAFPTTSEEKKRAKRENLEQKEILVPELCMIHPFPASLWRQAVCLPSILYRINALLLADEIRTTVAKEIALGLLQLPTDFEWRPLDFGWSPADVLRKSREENENKITALKAKNIPNIIELDDNNVEVKNEEDTNTTDLKDENLVIADEEEDSTWMEIGTWSNDKAGLEDFFDPDSDGSPNGALVCNGSPTSWAVGRNHGQELCLYDSDLGSDSSSDLDDDFSIQSEDSRTEMGRGLYSILSDYLAKAVDDESDTPSKESDWQWKEDGIILEKEVERETQIFNEATEQHKKHIMSSGIVVFHESPFIINHETSKSAIETSHEEHKLDFSLVGYAIPDELKLALKDNNMSQPSQIIAVNIDSSDSSDDEEDFEYPLFSFDEQSDLIGHPGPSPSIILQALTMSSAIDGINLGRLATIGDSFMKYAITTYLCCTYEGVREGKLSYLRSKLVSNLNLYRLGKRKVFGESMIATNFEPRNNWLPPCYLVPRKLEPALIEAGLPACQWNQADMSGLRDLSRDEINGILKERGEQLAGDLEEFDELPYNLITQQSIPDKSIADCVEALIGAYLIDCGPRGALLFLSWLGIRVLPYEEMMPEYDSNPKRQPGRLQPGENNTQICYGYLKPPRSPLMRHVPDADKQLNLLLNGFDVFEKKLKYRFQDRSYLLQAMTHTSYSPNRLTDCYQRLEFLGDAVLDYLITRHFYEDKQQHCPGALTDLRSALVNNTIFAVLAVRHGFHKFLRHLSPGLAEVVEQYVRIQEENSHAINEEYYLTGVEECEEAEDVEVPKVLGDVFESVAGAVFLDSQMSLDAVWKVYYRMMKSEIEKFSTNVPKSPLRELLEMQPHTAKIGKPEKLADGRHVRVTVEVIGIGVFKGIGRNYRIAKCNAAKSALKKLKKCRLLAQKINPGQR